MTLGGGGSKVWPCGIGRRSTLPYGSLVGGMGSNPTTRYHYFLLILPKEYFHFFADFSSL